MPKTAGAARHKEKTPAEDKYKIHISDFVGFSVYGRGAFYT